MAAKKILIVDDDTNITELIRLYFDKEGFLTTCASNGKEALENLGLWSEVENKLSLGTNVTEVLNWVAEQSADAGMGRPGRVCMSGICNFRFY